MRAMMKFSSATAVGALALLLANPVGAQGHAREGAQVIADRDAMQDSDLWLYNDVDAGFARARESGKPLLVVFR